MQQDRYPSSWNEYSGFIRTYGFDRFSFNAPTGEVNRFAARFRLATSFTGAELQGYTPETQHGYSALMKVFLCWSAIESFMKIMGVDREGLGRIANSYRTKEVAIEVAEIDSEKRFYGFIRERANKSHKKQLARYLSGEPHDVLFLASSIRHIFAHGDLTPNVSGMHPRQTARICHLLSELCIEIMDSEFSAKIQAELRAMAQER